MIALKYLSSWFWVDTFTTIPWQLIEKLQTSTGEEGGSGQAKILRIVRIQRLYRLVRIFRLFKLLRLFKYQRILENTDADSDGIVASILEMSDQAKRLLVISFLGLFSSHLMACTWFLQARLQNYPLDSWVQKEGLVDKSTSFQYLVSLYWSHQTLTRVGFGDVYSKGNTIEILVAIIWVLFSLIQYSVILSSIIQYVLFRDKEEEQL